MANKKKLYKVTIELESHHNYSVVLRMIQKLFSTKGHMICVHETGTSNPVTVKQLHESDLISIHVSEFEYRARHYVESKAGNCGVLHQYVDPPELSEFGGDRGDA